MAIKLTVTLEQLAALQGSLNLPEPYELFDLQIQRLRDNGFEITDQEVGRLRSFMPMDTQLFLIIPRWPDSFDLNILMDKVVVDRIRGVNRLKAGQLDDKGIVETDAHMLVDVQDGRKHFNVEPSESRENILKEGRLPFSVLHGLVLAIIFPHVLKKQSLNLVGAKCGATGVPQLSIYRRVPRLGAQWSNVAAPNTGAPSAQRIVGLPK